MFALMAFDHRDRQVVVSMFPFLKQQWQLTDAELGALVSVVAITVAVGTIPLSLLADRWGQIKSLFLMAVIWSLATIACAFATRYGELLLARALIGVGEAAYGSVGCAVLAGLFPERVRSTVLGAFLIAALIGSVLGVMVGGVVTHHWGWQAGFGVAGVPGLVLAVLFLVVSRGSPATSAASTLPRGDELRTAARGVLRELFRSRSAPVASIGAGFQLVAVSTMYAWLPSFLNRQYGFVTAHAGITAGLVVLMGVPGAVILGLVTDRLSGRFSAARYYVPAVAAMLTALFMASAFGVAKTGPTQLVLLALGAVTMASTVGPVTAAVIEVVPPYAQATAAAFLAATQNLFGLAIGPILTGMLSDRYGLAAAMTVVPMFCGIAGLGFVAAARTYPRDRARLEPVQGVAVVRLGM
jgi:predicted MFS family arabinose efflux permease